MQRIIDRLDRIKQLWKDLEQTQPDSHEYQSLEKQIRLLSDEYRALLDAPKKPRSA
jgi:hypothetical protein